MVYTKTDWKSGDTITAEKLNHLEEGVASALSATLNGKKILIIGDSINAGAGWSGGFANLIREEFPHAEVQNMAVSGAKLTENEIFSQLGNSYISGFLPDVIMMDGGGNDLLLSHEMGELNLDTYSDGVDTSTILGAMEFLFYRAQKYIPTAKIVFFNVYKIAPITTELATVPDYSVQKNFWTSVGEMCDKYGVFYVDFWGKSGITPAISEKVIQYMYDVLHINESGYRFLWPILRNAILF